jgi:hypothetical protein
MNAYALLADFAQWILLINELQSVSKDIHDQDLGYVFGHSLFAGKTGISVEEKQNAGEPSSPKWLFLCLQRGRRYSCQDKPT